MDSNDYVAYGMVMPPKNNCNVNISGRKVEGCVCVCVCIADLGKVPKDQGVISRCMGGTTCCFQEASVPRGDALFLNSTCTF